jgi:hypothetical protein
MAAQTADPAQTSVGRGLDAIRQLIPTGGLRPGETIRVGRLSSCNDQPEQLHRAAPGPPSGSRRTR